MSVLGGKVLLKKCKGSHIFDGYLLTNLVNFLTEFSASSVRLFRYMGSFAVFKLYSGLLETESQLSRIRESYLQKVDGRLTVLKDCLDGIFKSIFINRWRDVASEVRALCIDELAQWVSLMPYKYLDESFMDFFICGLADKASAVRSSSLSALILFFVQNIVPSGVRRYILKEKQRFFESLYDKDVNVATLASCLMVEIARGGFETFETSEGEKFEDFVFSNNWELAVSAGKYLIMKLTNGVDIKKFNGFEEDFADDYLRGLIVGITKFYQSSKYHDRAGFLVDAITGSHKVLRKLDLMAEILLGSEAEGYEDALIEIMSFSAKQCYAGVKIVRSESRVTCVKQISAAAPDKECSCNLATLFSYLSRLLCRYSNNDKNLVKLLSVLLCFKDDGQISKEVNDEVLSDLFASLKEIILGYCQIDVMEAVAGVFFRYKRLPSVSAEMKTICGKIMSEVEQHLFSMANEISCRDGDEVLLSLLEKCVVLGSLVDIRIYGLWFSSKKCTENFVKSLPDRMYIKILEMQFAILCWELKSLFYHSIGRGEKNKAWKVIEEHGDNFLRSVHDLSSRRPQCICKFFNQETMWSNLVALRRLTMKLEEEEGAFREIQVPPLPFPSFLAPNFFLQNPHEALPLLIDWFTLYREYRSETVGSSCEKLKNSVCGLFHGLFDADIGSFDMLEVIASFGNLFLNGYLSTVDFWVLLDVYRKVGKKAKEFLHSLMLKLSKSDHFGIAKAMSQVLIYSFLKFPVAEDEYISQVAEGFIQFLKREVHRRTMPEMVNLIICYGIMAYKYRIFGWFKQVIASCKTITFYLIAYLCNGRCVIKISMIARAAIRALIVRFWEISFSSAIIVV
ncbi:unnamed protein product [Enterobius vermicularis]|uniref:SCD domain-containing protein n=1 Tax=Enterobius vermicularis TaxID=51028 RepID=A0A0N4UZA4_ENTVE|nr:unnamed protein product [Enterobius vermicularis]